jgi:hypothetical protein
MQANKFAERWLLALAISSLITTNSFAQQKTIHIDQRQEPKTVIGILCSSSGGEHIRENVLKTPAGFLVVTTKDSTRYSGFHRQNAWSLGAQWHVVYRASEEFGLIAERVTFTGRVESSLAKVERLVTEYLDALSKNDYRRAYAKLSLTARRKISIDKFKSLYTGIDVNGSNAYVCTYSGDQLTMFIALGGESRTAISNASLCGRIMSGASMTLSRQ